MRFVSNGRLRQATDADQTYARNYKHLAQLTGQEHLLNEVGGDSQLREWRRSYNRHRVAAVLVLDSGREIPVRLSGGYDLTYERLYHLAAQVSDPEWSPYSRMPWLFDGLIKPDEYAWFTRNQLWAVSSDFRQTHKYWHMDGSAIVARRNTQLLGQRHTQATPMHRKTIPNRVKQFVWNRDGGRCVECDSNQRLEYDHIIPLALGGSDTERNLQLLCELCNRSKGPRIS